MSRGRLGSVGGENWEVEGLPIEFVGSKVFFAAVKNKFAVRVKEAFSQRCKSPTTSNRGSVGVWRTVSHPR